jgi:putative ABC transport system ATP-binding protein
VLLCDEPAGALNVDTGMRVFGGIARISSGLNTTTTGITHNPVIAEMADRVISISDGRILHVERRQQKKAASELTW